VGAIRTPSVEVTEVKVSQGTAASACGIAGAAVVCWGEGYSPADDPGKAVTIELAATKPASAVVDFAPPAGTKWPNDHLIHRGCSAPPKPLPACTPDVKGESWSSVLPAAANGKVFSVRDRLLVGPVDRDDNRRIRRIVVGEGESPLRFLGARGRYSCVGDESRLYCLTPALGQVVVATGKLLGSQQAGWSIMDPEVCEVVGGK
jgi:hypothetical protein